MYYCCLSLWLAKPLCSPWAVNACFEEYARKTLYIETAHRQHSRAPVTALAEPQMEGRTERKSCRKSASPRAPKTTQRVQRRTSCHRPKPIPIRPAAPVSCTQTCSTCHRALLRQRFGRDPPMAAHPPPCPEPLLLFATIQRTRNNAGNKRSVHATF